MNNLKFYVNYFFGFVVCLCFVFFFFFDKALAAISYDSGADTGTYITEPSVTFSHTTTGSDLMLFVCVSNQNLDGITSVTYNGSALSLYVSSSHDGSTGVADYLFYLKNPSVGTHDVVVTRVTNSAAFWAESESFSGVGNVEHYNEGKGTSSSHSIVTDSSGAWGVFCASGDTTLVGGSYGTIRRTPNSAVVSGDSGSAFVSVGSNTMIFSGGYFGWVAASFSAAVSGGESSPVISGFNIATSSVFLSRDVFDMYVFIPLLALCLFVVILFFGRFRFW